MTASTTSGKSPSNSRLHEEHWRTIVNEVSEDCVAALHWARQTPDFPGSPRIRPDFPGFLGHSVIEKLGVVW
jgi:hypothetical protein